MSSLSSLQGAALIANYAATKAWTLAFAEALSFELGDLGVDVLASCPGATRTPSYEAGNPRQTSFLAPAIMEPDQVVQETLDALGRKPVVIPGTGNRLAHAVLHRLLPRSVAVRLMGRSMLDTYGDSDD